MTTADPYASDKSKRFVGICIQRGGKGLGATFVLRNVIEDQGGVSAVVIMLQVFSKKCVKLQKFSLWWAKQQVKVKLWVCLLEYSATLKLCTQKWWCALYLTAWNCTVIFFVYVLGDFYTFCDGCAYVWAWTVCCHVNTNPFWAHCIWMNWEPRCELFNKQQIRRVLS